MNALHSTEQGVHLTAAMLNKDTAEELGTEDLKTCGYAFQLFDIQVMDDLPGDSPEEDEYTDAPCFVCVFGADADGRSVMAKIHGFKPCIFVELPWYTHQPIPASQIKEKFTCEMKRHLGKTLPKYEVRFVCASRLGGYVPPMDASKGGIHKNLYAKMSFNNLRTMSYVAKTLKRKLKHLVCEERVPPPLKFCDSIRTQSGRELQPCGWIGLSEVNIMHSNKQSWCDVELVCDIQHVHSLPDVNRMAPILIASYDIECVSPSGDFPDPTKDDNPVVVIGTTYKRIGTFPQRNDAPNISTTIRTSHVLGSCDNVEGVHLFSHQTEQAMINAWSREITQYARADCIIGYNIFGFDNAYLAKRSQRKAFSELLYTSKLREELVQPVAKTLSSSAMGDNEVHHIPMSGRFSVDMYQWIKNRFSNLKSLSLDFVSRNFLGESAEDGKIALPYSKIGVAFGSSGSAKLRAEVVEYCAQDCDLPLRLAEKLSTIQEVTEMSRVCHTLVNDVLTRGQQIKVYSHLLVAAHKMGFVMNDLPPVKADTEKYTGATVLDPTPGFYNDLPVVTLDFASLYPSVMRSKNLCFSSWVPPGTTLPDYVETETFELGNGKTACFVKASTHKGVLPRVLESLLQARKMTRSKLKQLPKGSDERNLLDGRQLAYKITCNSCYGFCGSNQGMYPLKAIAETTTCVGRAMIDSTKRIMEEQYDAQVIYGDTDSVMVVFPLSKEGKTENELIKESFGMGERAAETVTTYFDDCNELECEKTSFPYLLFGKKTYAARVFEDPDGVPKLDVKGLAVVRRDTCDFAANALKATLDALMMERSVDNARKIVDDTIDCLVKNKVPMEDLTLSKRLSGTYRNENLPHLAVVRKMEERNPGSAPKSGDRVPYVLIETSNRKAKVFEKAEDPTYVTDHGLKIDRLHYLTNHLIKPVTQLFSPFEPEPSIMFKQALFELERQQTRQTTLCCNDSGTLLYTRHPEKPVVQAVKKRKQSTLTGEYEQPECTLQSKVPKKEATDTKPIRMRQLTLFQSASLKP